MKYALIDNNKIEVGPRDWHSAFFNNYLKTQNIVFTLPVSYAETTAIQITPSIKIVSVVEPAIPSYDPITEQLAGPVYDTSVDPITGTYTVADIPLNAVKNKILSILAEKRYNKENTTIKVTVQGQQVSVDTSRGNDREIWVQSLILLPANATQTYKFPKEQIWLTLTISDIQIIINAIMLAVQNAFTWEAGYVTSITAATTKLQLQNLYTAIVPPGVTNGI